MGADIHSFAEVRTNNKWVRVEEPKFDDSFDKTTAPFSWRSYSMFAFLAGVRNYSHCTPISEPKGLPVDSEWLNSPSEYSYSYNPMSGETISENERETNKSEIYDNGNYHSLSWLTLKELLDFDYEQKFWDRRISKQVSPNGWSGAELAEDGEGKVVSYREFLGKGFFIELDVLKTLGSPNDVRIIFWFDN